MSTEIIKTESVSVRIMELEKNTSTDWHYHTAVRDYFVCLNGVIRVEKLNPDERPILQAGQTTEAIPLQVHRVVNICDERSEYLLVQGVGVYDFVSVTGPDSRSQCAT